MTNEQTTTPAVRWCDWTATTPDANIPDLRWYDWILINTSAGKDSLAMLDYVVGLAKEADVLDRVVAVHADLGRVEWEGTKRLAREQALRYGVRFAVVSRDRDLLHQVEFERKKWPGYGPRFCTSDQKTKEVVKLMTRLVDEWLDQNELPSKKHRPSRRVRILNCLGLRAQESPKRRDMEPFTYEEAASNPTKRLVSRWLPIHGWTEDQVWARIHEKGLKYHWA